MQEEFQFLLIRVPFGVGAIIDASEGKVPFCTGGSGDLFGDTSGGDSRYQVPRQWRVFIDRRYAMNAIHRTNLTS